MGHWNTSRSAAYLDLQFETDSEGLLRKKLYDKRDDVTYKWKVQDGKIEIIPFVVKFLS
jgi:hypothetical protein